MQFTSYHLYQQPPSHLQPLPPSHRLHHVLFGLVVIKQSYSRQPEPLLQPNCPKESWRIWIVFDSGSQCPYLKEQIAKGHLLTLEEERALMIMAFGSRREQTCVCNWLSDIGTDNKRWNLEATIPTVCKPIVCQPISICCNNWDHIAGLELAEVTKSLSDRIWPALRADH